MQDAHNTILNYDTNASLFAVYDGHGGQEVAEYSAKNLPDYIKHTSHYQENRIEKVERSILMISLSRLIII